MLMSVDSATNETINSTFAQVFSIYNSTLNQTTKVSPQLPGYVIALVWTYTVLMITTLLLNILCCIVFITAYCRYKTLRQNNFTFYVLHMTIADLFSVLGIIFVGLITKRYPAQNQILCGTYFFTFFLPFEVSYCLTLLTAADRYIAVIYPVRHLNIMTKSRMRLSVVTVWVGVATVLLLMNYLFSYWQNICFITMFIPKYQFIMFSCFGVASICIATGGLYLKLAWSVWLKKRKVTVNGGGNPDVGQQQLTRTHSSTYSGTGDFRTALRSALFTFSLALTLVICRLPYTVVTLILYDSISVQAQVAWLFSLLLIVATPLINFVMYSMKFVEIRYLLITVVRCGRAVSSTSGNNVVLHITQRSEEKRFSRMHVQSSYQLSSSVF